MSRSSRSDLILSWGLRASATLAGAVLLLIVAILIFGSVLAWQAIKPSQWFTDPDWYPQNRFYRLTPMIAGSLAVTALAVAAATPLGLLSAIFCRFYAPARLATAYRHLIGLLSGIPSVVYGLWGLLVLAPFIARFQPPGLSLLAGAVVLTLMVLPTIALTADAALAAVPRESLQGAAALGLTRWTTVRRVAIPAARSGIFSGIILAVGRAMGETIAVIMVCGNMDQFPKSLFDPILTLTANIGITMSYAMGIHRSALFLSGLFLVGIVAVLVLAAAAAARRGHVRA